MCLRRHSGPLAGVRMGLSTRSLPGQCFWGGNCFSWPPRASPSLVQVPWVGEDPVKVFVREDPAQIRMAPALAWVEGQASIFQRLLPGRPRFQGFFLLGTSMCLSQILAPWPLPSPSACRWSPTPAPAVSGAPHRSVHAVPIWSKAAASPLPGPTPQPPQGSLCLCPQARVHVPLPSESPPCLSEAQMLPKLFGVATQACPHLRPVPGNPAPELAPRDSFWLAPEPSHMLFP